MHKITISDVPNLIDFWGCNPDLNPSEISASKNMRVNWKCPDCGYEWEANIHSRYYDRTGCPACAGKVVTESNNALALYPELEKFYDKELNTIPLDSIFPRSETKIYWKCPDCGYQWEQAVINRIRDGKVRGCAICTGAKIVGTYKDKYPDVAEMYSEKNERPFEDLKSADRKTPFLWKCKECGCEFTSTLGSMLLIIKKPHKGCPNCRKG
jgi:rubrerythrin